MDSNGNVIINNDVVLYPNYEAISFKKSKYYNGQDLSLFFWIKEDCEINGHKYKVGLYFKEKKLMQIQLYCMDYGIKDEGRRKIVHDNILKELSLKTEYNWGNIRSIFSKRDNTSLIIINYNWNRTGEVK